jgi:hypothetical protein
VNVVRASIVEFGAAIDKPPELEHPFRKGGLQMRALPQTQDPTNNVGANLASAALIGFALVLPLAILESLNNTITRHSAPGLIVLFGLLWLLPTAFIVILLPLVRAVRAGEGVAANPFKLLFRVVLLALIATMWGGLLFDQFPCFMGVPNCD